MSHPSAIRNTGSNKPAGSADLAPLNPLNPPAGRLEWLDSIRGLAALAVLLGHAWGGFVAPPGWSTICVLPFAFIFFDGRTAVTMFFVLSGFVLSRPYVGGTTGIGGKKLPVFPFYVKRITRIYIPWFCVFALSLAAQAYWFPWVASLGTAPPKTEWIQTFWSPWTRIDLIKQCLFSLHKPTILLLPQDWSLGVELKGSALIPLFIFLLRRHLLLLLGAGAALLIFVGTGYYYISFVLGVLLARYSLPLEAWLRPKPVRFKVLIVFAGLLLYQARLVAIVLKLSHSSSELPVWCIASVGCVMIIGGSLGSRRIQKTLSHSVFVFFGRISFSVYLLQFLVILSITPVFVHYLNALGIHSPYLIFPASLLLTFSICTLLSLFTYQYIEVPGMKLGRWLTRRSS